MLGRSLAISFLWLTCVIASAARIHAADEDPVINGKKLSEWVVLLKAAKGTQIMGVSDVIGGAGPKAVGAVPALLEVMQKTRRPPASRSRMRRGEVAVGGATGSAVRFLETRRSGITTAKGSPKSPWMCVAGRTPGKE